MSIEANGELSAFVAAAGLALTEVGPRRVTGEIELSEAHHTPWGVVHGGVFTTAIETAASVGASAAAAEHGQFAVGVNNNTDFLRAMKAGIVDVVAEPQLQGRVQQLWEVRITRREDLKEIARGRVRLQNVTPRE